MFPNIHFFILNVIPSFEMTNKTQKNYIFSVKKLYFYAQKCKIRIYFFLHHEPFKTCVHTLDWGDLYE